jgi:hypothetical protein
VPVKFISNSYSALIACLIYDDVCLGDCKVGEPGDPDWHIKTFLLLVY